MQYMWHLLIGKVTYKIRIIGTTKCYLTKIYIEIAMIVYLQ